MTSSINPNNIDGNYPVAGVPNNTQGFRDNFTNIQTNFQYASDEITELQNKSVLKAAITGSTLDNNMNDNLIYAVKLQDVSWTLVNVTATSGTIPIDYSAGEYQQINTTGSVSVNFTNWPESGSVGSMKVAFNITNTAYTVTFPAAVSQGLYGIEGISPGTAGVSNTITFSNTGNYAFEFITPDGGATIWIFDLSRPMNRFNAPVIIDSTANSTSTTSGSLQVAGGVGVLGNVNIGGNLVTYTSTGNIAFSAMTTGFVSLNVPSVPGNVGGALNIVGSANDSYQPVLNTGSMLHVTGNDGVSSRVTIDAFGTSVSPVFTVRNARGTAASPTATQSGDILARYTFSGWGTTGYVLDTGNIAPTGIDAVALQTFTDSVSGSALKFYTAPIGSKVKTLSANVTANVTTFPANVSATGNVIVSGSAGVALVDGGTVGYGTGSGGTVTQGGNKSTGVTLNKPSGEITMAATNLAAAASVSFTLTNSTIGARDVMIINLVGGGTVGAYFFGANCTTGSAVVTVSNRTAGTLGEALVLRYVVIKGSVT